MRASDGSFDLRLLYASEAALRGRRAILIVCPFHADRTPSFAIYPDGAKCFGCGAYETPAQHLRRIGFRQPPALKEPPSPPPAASLPVSQPAPESGLGIAEQVEQYHRQLFLLGKQEWLMQRGLTLDIIERAKLGHTGTAYAIPIFQRMEPTDPLRPITIRFRRDDALSSGSGPKYWDLPGSNTQLYVPFGLSPSMIWCEGELDALIVGRIGRHSLTLTNGASQSPDRIVDPALFRSVREVVVAFDHDPAGLAGRFKIVRFLRSIGLERIVVVQFREKDLTALWQARGDAGFAEVLSGRTGHALVCADRRGVSRSPGLGSQYGSLLLEG